MKAAVCREFNRPLTIEEVALAPPGAGEVQVRLAACAICHSDVSYLRGAWGGRLPAIYGHEAAGVVEAVGEGVAQPRPGERVIVTLIRSCGHCRYCAQGRSVLCEATFALDRRSPLSAADGSEIVQGLRTGAFADRVTVDASQVAVVPPALPLDAAALIACGVLTGFGAVVNTAQAPPGASAVVVGTGGVGLNSIQGAAISGCEPIIGVDPSAAKRTAALAFGATHALDAMRPDLAAEVRRLTHGRGADYVFVATGAPGVLDAAFRLLARGGVLVVVGMPASGVTATFDPGNFAGDGQRVLGSKMGSARLPTDVPRILDLHARGRLKLEELISGRFALEEINLAVDGVVRGEVLRNVVVF